MGSLFMLPVSYPKLLKAKGIQCTAFNPVMPLYLGLANQRDHRKILVIDDKVAYSGGINLADEYINEIKKHGHWKDTGIRLEGSGVWSYTHMFLSMWNAINKQDQEIAKYKSNHSAGNARGYVQPYGVSPLAPESVGRNVYVDILNQAKSYVYIFTPYLIIDDATQLALTMAAKRGVNVRIVTPGIPDKKVVYRLTRSYYAPLLKHGVRIYEYSPGFMHAKNCVCDDEFSMIGTINMDYRSLFLHYECASLLYGTDCTREMKQDALDVFQKSREVQLSDCNSGFWGALLDTVLRTMAPLF